MCGRISVKVILLILYNQHITGSRIGQCHFLAFILKKLRLVRTAINTKRSMGLSSAEKWHFNVTCQCSKSEWLLYSVAEPHHFYSIPTLALEKIYVAPFSDWLNKNGLCSYYYSAAEYAVIFVILF
jgi:hypothetical protein